jgi:hypothetical protein
VKTYVCDAARQRDILMEALWNLLDDTQHADHPDCEDGPCPVREARAVLDEVDKEIGGA